MDTNSQSVPEQNSRTENNHFSFFPFVILGIVIYSVLYYFMNADSFNKPGTETILLLLGMLIGVGVCFGDEKYFYKYYVFEETASTMHDLVTRSLLFLLSYFPLSFFIISSGGSKFGVGLFLGMGVFLAQEIWGYRDDIEAVHRRYLYQLARKLSATEVWWAVRGFIGGVGVLLLLALA